MTYLNGYKKVTFLQLKEGMTAPQERLRDALDNLTDAFSEASAVVQSVLVVNGIWQNEEFKVILEEAECNLERLESVPHDLLLTVENLFTRIDDFRCLILQTKENARILDLNECARGFKIFKLLISALIGPFLPRERMSKLAKFYKPLVLTNF